MSRYDIQEIREHGKPGDVRVEWSYLFDTRSDAYTPVLLKWLRQRRDVRGKFGDSVFRPNDEFVMNGYRLNAYYIVYGAQLGADEEPADWAKHQIDLLGELETEARRIFEIADIAKTDATDTQKAVDRLSKLLGVPFDFDGLSVYENLEALVGRADEHEWHLALLREAVEGLRDTDSRKELLRRIERLEHLTEAEGDNINHALSSIYDQLAALENTQNVDALKEIFVTPGGVLEAFNRRLGGWDIDSINRLSAATRVNAESADHQHERLNNHSDRLRALEHKLKGVSTDIVEMNEELQTVQPAARAAETGDSLPVKRLEYLEARMMEINKCFDAAIEPDLKDLRERIQALENLSAQNKNDLVSARRMIDKRATGSALYDHQRALHQIDVRVQALEADMCAAQDCGQHEGAFAREVLARLVRMQNQLDQHTEQLTALDEDATLQHDQYENTFARLTRDLQKRKDEIEALEAASVEVDAMHVADFRAIYERLAALEKSAYDPAYLPKLEENRRNICQTIEALCERGVIDADTTSLLNSVVRGENTLVDIDCLDAPYRRDEADGGYESSGGYNLDSWEIDDIPF